jgi:hypothetical protein
MPAIEGPIAVPCQKPGPGHDENVVPGKIEDWVQTR